MALVGAPPWSSVIMAFTRGRGGRMYVVLSIVFPWSLGPPSRRSEVRDRELPEQITLGVTSPQGLQRLDATQSSLSSRLTYGSWWASLVSHILRGPPSLDVNTSSRILCS
jgi:hypothetical protein